MSDLSQRLGDLQIRLLEVQLETHETQLAATREHTALLVRKAKADLEASEVALERERLMVQHLKAAIEANDLPKIKSFTS